MGSDSLMEILNGVLILSIRKTYFELKQIYERERRSIKFVFLNTDTCTCNITCRRIKFFKTMSKENIYCTSDPFILSIQKNYSSNFQCRREDMYATMLCWGQISRRLCSNCVSFENTFSSLFNH